jgi:hypothetical protein
MGAICDSVVKVNNTRCTCTARYRFLIPLDETNHLYVSPNETFSCGKHVQSKLALLQRHTTHFIVTEFLTPKSQLSEVLHRWSNTQFIRAIRPHRVYHHGDENWLHMIRGIKNVCNVHILPDIPLGKRNIPIHGAIVHNLRVVRPPPPMVPRNNDNPRVGAPPVEQAAPLVYRDERDQAQIANDNAEMLRRAQEENVIVLPVDNRRGEDAQDEIANAPEAADQNVRFMDDPATPMVDGETRTCSICMVDDGVIVCDNKLHSMCMDCFGDYAISESNNAAFKGSLRCCCTNAFGCTSNPFDTLSIIRMLPEEKAKLFMNGMIKANERILYTEFERMRLDDSKRGALSTDADKAYGYILNNVLTLHCPNETCKQALFDYDGCMALTCSRCSKEICGKCFESFPNVHAHILSGECKIDPSKTLFGNAEYILNTQRVYRTHKLNAYIKTLKPSVAVQVIERCKAELVDLGIAVNVR